MVDTKKEQEREELHRAIWAIADDLRGAVDGWDFKSYVLGTMFYRYISENIASYINQGEIDAGNPDFRYEDMSDAEAECSPPKPAPSIFSKRNTSATWNPAKWSSWTATR